MEYKIKRSFLFGISGGWTRTGFIFLPCHKLLSVGLIPCNEWLAISKNASLQSEDDFLLQRAHSVPIEMGSTQQQQLQHPVDHHSIGEENQPDHGEFSSNNVQHREEMQQNEIENPIPVIHSTIQQASNRSATDLISPRTPVQLSERISQKEEVNDGAVGEVDDFVANNTQPAIHSTSSSSLSSLSSSSSSLSLSSSSSSVMHVLEHHHAQGGFGNNFYGLISSFAIAAVMNYTMTCMKRDDLIMNDNE